MQETRRKAYGVDAKMSAAEMSKEICLIKQKARGQNKRVVPHPSPKTSLYEKYSLFETGPRLEKC